MICYVVVTRRWFLVRCDVGMWVCATGPQSWNHMALEAAIDERGYRSVDSRAFGIVGG